jgi:hypothetical protein
MFSTWVVEQGHEITYILFHNHKILALIHSSIVARRLSVLEQSH